MFFLNVLLSSEMINDTKRIDLNSVDSNCFFLLQLFFEMFILFHQSPEGLSHSTSNNSYSLENFIDIFFDLKIKISTRVTVPLCRMRLNCLSQLWMNKTLEPKWLLYMTKTNGLYEQQIRFSV